MGWILFLPSVMPSTPPDLPDAPISEHDIHRLVHRFYARVRQDDTLGPIFEARVTDWDAHLAMTDQGYARVPESARP